jgi:hypothetical protein
MRLTDAKRPGRPLSARSAWALVALSVSDPSLQEGLAASERSRAGKHLELLYSEAATQEASSDEHVHAVAVLLRLMLRNRAERHAYRPRLSAQGYE